MRDLNKIADEMIYVGRNSTNYGNWIFYQDEEYDGVELRDLTKEECDELIDILWSREEVSDVEVDDEDGCISVTFWLVYCPLVEIDYED